MSYDNEKEYADVAKQVESSQIDRYLIRIVKSLDEQEELIRLLNTRLERVTTPEEDEANAEPMEDLLVPLASQLRQDEKVINRNNRRIRDLIDRIQL